MGRKKIKRRLEMGEEAWAEYQRKRKNAKSERYKERQRPVEWRRRTKLRLIEYKGGKCQDCGWDDMRYPRHFVFHHRDPSQKDFHISGKTLKWETLQKEVDKCDLLCGRCHDILHEQEYLQEREKAIRERRTICRHCGTDFLRHNYRQKYCSPSCRLKHRCPTSKHRLPRSYSEMRVCPQCHKPLNCTLGSASIFCSPKCYYVYRRIVKRPSKKELSALVSTSTWLAPK